MAGSHVHSSHVRLIPGTRLLALAALVALILASSLFSPRTAHAAFHFAEISEILVGYGADPNVQFVEIQMEGGQNFVGSTKLSIWDATGAYVSTFTLPANNLANGADEARWIMGTTEFDELVEPGAPQFVDYVIPGGMPAAGGMVCWGSPFPDTNPYSYVDCIAYGTYDDVCTGDNPPFEPNCPSSPPKHPGVPSDCFHSLTRTIPAVFDGQTPPNDTWADGNNALDFDDERPPSPTNNAGVTKTLPLTPDADGDQAPDCIDPNTGVVDTDADGCADGEELRASQAMGGQRDNTSTFDFFDVPSPANGPPAADGKPTLNAAAVKNQAVSLGDAATILAYVGRTSTNPAYIADANGDGLMDGAQLDRSPSTNPLKPWQSGPPSGAVTLADVSVNLSQVGHNCSGAPN